MKLLKGGIVYITLIIGIESIGCHIVKVPEGPSDQGVLVEDYSPEVVAELRNPALEDTLDPHAEVVHEERVQVVPVLVPPEDPAHLQQRLEDPAPPKPQDVRDVADGGLHKLPAPVERERQHPVRKVPHGVVERDGLVQPREGRAQLANSPWRFNSTKIENKFK